MDYRRAFGLAGICLFAWTLPVAAVEPERIDFARQIGSLLSARCLDCHNPNEPKGGLDLSTAATTKTGGDGGTALVPGQPDDSPLLDAITPLAPGEPPAMPKKGPPLTAAEIALIRQWIAEGANWPETVTLRPPAKADLSWWSLQPLQEIAPPDPADLPAGWGTNPIDRFLFAKLTAAGLRPNPPAEKAVLLRRVTFDLTGLPPTPEELAAFLADESPDAYDRVVDRLLASPRYGERWARHWLDAVRFAESDGFETNQPRPNAWPYRDYVIRSLNADLPYNQFVREQLAGDTLGADAATGFLVGGAWDRVKSPDPVLTAQQRADELHDMTATTASTFLGLTVGCARCHDHKFDPIRQVDYYAIKACFAGVQHGERPLQTTDSAERLARAEEFRKELRGVEARLTAFVPPAGPHRLIPLDDSPAAKEMPEITRLETRALTPPSGLEPHVGGRSRGEVNDPGDLRRLPNLGRSYTWWAHPQRQDLFTWSPRLSGKHRVWLSWGCGWNTHATDARYLLDLDGNPATREDQTEIARVNQQRFADGTGDPVNKPLWSGFYNAGEYDLTPTACILLRGGEADAPVTADLLLFEELPADTPASATAAVPGVRAAVTQRENIERFPATRATFVRLSIFATTGAEPCVDELEIFAADDPLKNLALAAIGAKATASSSLPGHDIHQLAHVNDGQYGNARSWISNEKDAGWVQIELAEPREIDRVLWSRDRDDVPPHYTDRLATNYRIEVSLDGVAWTTVAQHHDRLPFDFPVKPEIRTLSKSTPEATAEFAELRTRQQTLAAEVQRWSSNPMVYAGRFGTPDPVFRLHRGDPTQPREPVLPGVIEQLGPAIQLTADATEPERRLALANWIVDPANPLPARVMVNRLWQHHFGTGLVETPSDFGYGGGRPTHPELLDWLAREFIARGWSLKQMHRLIVTAQAYRQTSDQQPAGRTADATARLLWRFPPQRLEAEPLRDTILAVSGALDLTMGGPGFDLFEPNTNYVKVYNSRREFGPESFRRMIYQNKPRMQLDEIFGAFDCPDAGQIAPRRNSSITPLQALNLLNSPFLIQQADLFAERLEREAGDDPQQQAERGFLLAFGRKPDAEEMAAASLLIKEESTAAFCRALFNASEFLMIY